MIDMNARPVQATGHGVWRSVLAGLATLALCGCTLLPGTGATLEIFDLRAPSTAAVPRVQDWQLAVDVFAAREPVSGVRIAVREDNGSLGVLSGARWSLPAPRLLQSVLVEAFEQSRGLAGVGPADAVRGDCRLGGELRAFEWRPTGAGASGAVTIVIAARLQCGAGDQVRAMRTFEASADVRGTGAGAVVAAFTGALAQSTPELLAWVLAEGAPGS